MLRVDASEYLITHCELHVPAGGVESRLALVLQLLHQRPHLCRDAPHQMGRRLAGPRGGHRVGDSRGGQRPAGMLAAVGEEGRVP
jgi:hypothetical protein